MIFPPQQNAQILRLFERQLSFLGLKHVYIEVNGKLALDLLEGLSGGLTSFIALLSFLLSCENLCRGLMRVIYCLGTLKVLQLHDAIRPVLLCLGDPSILNGCDLISRPFNPLLLYAYVIPEVVVDGLALSVLGIPLCLEEFDFVLGVLYHLLEGVRTLLLQLHERLLGRGLYLQ